MNKGCNGAILSPTYGMLIDTILPTFEATLNTMKIKYTYTGGKSSPIFILHWKKGNSRIYFKSAENYRRLASLNLAWAVVDEADLLDRKTGNAMWKMLIGRIRTGTVRQLCATSTPEGFNLLHDIFVTNAKPFKHCYHASSEENYHIGPDYIDDLRANYNPTELQAYLDGEFTHLNSGQVYFTFDREESRCNTTVNSLCTDKTRPNLFIGVDFNVGQTCGIVCCIVDKEVHVVDEFVKVRDTEQLIEQIAARYAGYQVFIFPDSSGKSQQTATTMTDITILKDTFGGYNVKYPSKNPRIMNRVKAVNAMFLNGKGVRRLRVNTDMCPTLTTCLEQQAYSETTGQPEKKHDLDHPLDALGYYIHHQFAIVRKPILRNF